MFTILISCCRQNNWWKQRRYCCGPIPSLSGTNTSLLSYLFVISTNSMEFMSLFFKSNLWLISYLLFKLINSSLYSSSVFDWVPLLFFLSDWVLVCHAMSTSQEYRWNLHSKDLWMMLTGRYWFDGNPWSQQL
jgi:hypothetical protein